MGMTWQIQDAKNRFSEVVECALNDGPQEITKHGEKSVVLLSMSEYTKLKRRNGTLAEFFKRSPLAAIDIERTQDL